MMNLFLDIAPLPHGDYPRVIRRVIVDTVDTVAPPVQQIIDSPASGSGSGSSLGVILGAILAALVALGICIFMVRAARRRGEQQLGYKALRS